MDFSLVNKLITQYSDYFETYRWQVLAIRIQMDKGEVFFYRYYVSYRQKIFIDSNYDETRSPNSLIIHFNF